MTAFTGAASLPATRIRALQTPLQLFAGFFFAFRMAITFLGFQSDPRTGTIVSLACAGLLFAAALFCTIGDDHFSLRPLLSTRTLRWLAAYLAVTGLTLFWTGASSLVDAAGQWTGMTMQVLAVLLLIRNPGLPEKVDALLKGFVIGMLVVAAAAWLSPRTEELRLGNTDFLHPNTLGLNCAIAFFLAQYISFRKPAWKWCCVALGITLLRTFSKTSIIAFVIAEAFYLLRESRISRATKFRIAAVAMIVAAAFATQAESYLEAYNSGGSGTAAETFTGRTVIWAYAATTALERPWFGHGFYSFRALAPAFGTFQPWAAHNEVLQQLFEYGLLGLGAAIGLYLSLFMAARRSPALQYRGLVVVLMVFILIHGLTDSLNFDLTFPLWLAAALAIALSQPPQAAAS